MKGWIGSALSVGIIAFAVTIHQTNLLGELPMVENPVIMTVLAGTICLVIVLAMQTSEYAVSRQVALWTLSAAVITLAVVNLNQLAEKRKKIAAIQAIEKQQARKAEFKKRKIKKRKADAGLLPDTPELEKRGPEKVYDRSRFDPLAPKTDKKARLTNQLTTPDKPLDENWEPSEEQKELFKKFLKSKGLRYDPETAYKFPPDKDENLFTKQP